jgi:hypothetical protein
LKKIEDEENQKLDFQLICGRIEFCAEGLNRGPSFWWRISAVVVRLNFEGLEVNEH